MNKISEKKIEPSLLFASNGIDVLCQKQVFTLSGHVTTLKTSTFSFFVLRYPVESCVFKAGIVVGS